MNDDFLNAIWEQFGIETEEHLETIEQRLLQAEQGHTPSSDDISSLFRAFHSIKGLAKAMDLSALERLSHRAEDLLGLVREGTTALTPALAGLLLTTNDHLRQLAQHASASRENGELPTALLAQLEHACQLAARGQTLDAAQLSTLESSLPPAAVSPPPAAAPVRDKVQLHDDPDMLSFFMDILREEMTSLAELAKHLAQNIPLSNEQRQRLQHTCESLNHACTVMEFDSMAQHAGALATMLLPNEAPLCHQTGLNILGNLLADVHFMEQETHINANSENARHWLNQTAMEDVQPLFAQIAEHFFTPMPTNDDGQYAQTAAHALNELINALAPTAESLSLHALSTLREQFIAKPHDVHLADQGCELLLAVKNHLEAPTPTSRDAAAVMLEELIAQLTHHEVPAQYDVLPLPLQASLSGTQREHLEELLANGHSVYLIALNPEANPERTPDLLRWLADENIIVTNRARTELGGGEYEFLLATTQTLDTFRQALQNHAPEARILHYWLPDGTLDAAVEISPPPLAPLVSQQTTTSIPTLPPEPQRSAASNVLRVPGELLDALINRSGEALMLASRLDHLLRDGGLGELLPLLRQSGHDNSQFAQQLASSLDNFDAQQRQIQDIHARLTSELKQLQDAALTLRVVPIELVFRRLPRVIRDLALQSGKQVRCELHGDTVKIDKSMIEALTDPLLHMVRNAVDHGVELPHERSQQGKAAEALIFIQAEQEGDRVLITIRDDGRGINAERVRQRAVERGLVSPSRAADLGEEEIYQLLFLPGFSTAETVTETSGRGVGMDVVKTNIQRLGGSIRVASQPGQGTTFTLLLPLSAAMQESLLVVAGGQTLALPARAVVELLEYPPDALQYSQGQAAVVHHEHRLPVVDLGQLLGFNRCEARHGYHHAAIISNGRQRVALSVSQVIGRRELFVKETALSLTRLPAFGGASLLGDGRVVIILDIDDLLHLATTSETKAN